MTIPRTALGATPTAAPKLPVGEQPEAELLLLGQHAKDLAVLDLAQALWIGAAVAQLQELLGPQEAADVVGTVGISTLLAHAMPFPSPFARPLDDLAGSSWMEPLVRA